MFDHSVPEMIGGCCFSVLLLAALIVGLVYLVRFVVRRLAKWQRLRRESARGFEVITTGKLPESEERDA